MMMLVIILFLDLILSYVLAFVELHEDLSKGKTVHEISQGESHDYLPTFPVILYMTQVSKFSITS